MPKFDRSFDVSRLAEWDAAAHPGNAVRALFDQWALPGECSTASRMLRVGIRDGYLNLYAKGQSVAKLVMRRTGPVVEVHQTYVSGRRSTAKSDKGTTPGRQYVSFAADALANPEIAALVPGWIAAAESCAGAEKRFVDQLIAANAGAVDLEMGLPASDLEGGDRAAPRMDLVVGQIAPPGAPAIAFWEAKCAHNAELRASGASAPKVLAQVDRYVRWMSEADCIAEVRQAYRSAAAIFRDLHRLFRAAESPAPECLDIWNTLAEAEASTVIVHPGIVVCNYSPEHHAGSIASDRMAQAAASFAKNKHRDKLQRAGVQVHQVGPDHDGPTLPMLPPARTVV